VEIIVAETIDHEIIGFIASVNSYDLHWCVKGGDVIDFYVSPSHRGQGAAMLLIAGLAAEVKKHEGAYLKGGAVNNPVVRQLYQKIAMCLPDGETYISGRAFRHLAELSGKSLREIVKNLPQTAWNYEA
jgi:GNAT superfamily N-acetyltransferase